MAHDDAHAPQVLQSTSGFVRCWACDEHEICGHVPQTAEVCDHRGPETPLHEHNINPHRQVDGVQYLAKRNKPLGNGGLLVIDMHDPAMIGVLILDNVQDGLVQTTEIRSLGEIHHRGVLADFLHHTAKACCIPRRATPAEAQEEHLPRQLQDLQSVHVDPDKTCNRKEIREEDGDNMRTACHGASNGHKNQCGSHGRNEDVVLHVAGQFWSLQLQNKE
mmetsp:Transcript_125411/g.348987  ORF Transcript_125411/g.348987 Transcript_125411/m.348987 type:complete len:219 (+) Transcript_125411:324-980(+)